MVLLITVIKRYPAVDDKGRHFIKILLPILHPFTLKRRDQLIILKWSIIKAVEVLK